jgi:tetratricopeptide (TPR) repeat protein
MHGLTGSWMRKAVEQKLEEINKLIFVKRYAEAEKRLEAISESADGQDNILVHIRRIELAAMLKKLDRLKSHYIKNLKKNAGDLTSELCFAFIEQQEDTPNHSELVNTFQEIMRQHGQLAAAYYGIGFSLEQQGNYERAVFNYEKCVSIDTSWYIAYFGLSQIYYQMGDEKRGDHFFYQFEQAAPYYVYGNFETHRKLCQEFLERELYADAEQAIQSLTEWWQENKGTCPVEIQIYEMLAMSRISRAQGDAAQADTRRNRALGMALVALDDASTQESVLYFIAKVLEEFDEYKRSVQFYKKILQKSDGDPALVQKIGGQFLSLGEYQTAKELFEDAYNAHPENPDIRFCLLVASLKIAGVNVEDYLIGRERLRQLVDGGDKVELLALLHSLLAKFTADPDVQGHIADVYLRLGNIDRAERHYENMFRIDGRNRQTALKYASFVMQYRDPDKAMDILKKINDQQMLSTDSQAEIYWLKANYFSRKKEHRESLTLLRKVLAIDPWNVSYLIQEVLNLIAIARVDEELRVPDPILATMTSIDESKIVWTEYDQKTRWYSSQHEYELVYARQKLRYLYANGAEDTLKSLVTAAAKHDPVRATYDLMRLLNTNFDSPSIYWALGTLYKEQWQLETAAVWFEQMLIHPSLPAKEKARAYIELADCFVWQNRQIPKAIEYAKLAIDLDNNRDPSHLRVLAHAHLRSGQVRQAKLYLEQADIENDHEARYLQGLVQYRNGMRKQANDLWKPLLTVRSESLRFHNIKQEVLKYYFDGAPYLKAN